MARNGGRLPVTGEAVVHRGVVHRAVYMRAGLAWVAALAVSQAVPGLSFLCFAIACAVHAQAFLARATTHAEVTGSMVVVKTGLLKRIEAARRLDTLEGTTLNQDMLGRLLGYGTLTVGGSWGGRIVIPFLADPDAFRHSLEEARDRTAGR